MTFTEAAILILRAEGKPLTWRKLAELAVRHELLSLVGTDPADTMRVRLADVLRHQGEAAPFVEAKGGTYSLRAWGGSAPGPSADAVQEMESYKQTHAAAPAPVATGSPAPAGRRRARGGRAVEAPAGRRRGAKGRGAATSSGDATEGSGVESTEGEEREATTAAAPAEAKAAPAARAPAAASSEAAAAPNGGEDGHSAEGRKRRRRGRRGRGGTTQAAPASAETAASVPEPSSGARSSPAAAPPTAAPVAAQPDRTVRPPTSAAPVAVQPDRTVRPPTSAATVAGVPCDLGRAADSALRLLRGLGARRPLRLGEILSQWASRGAAEAKLPPAALAAALAASDGSQKVGGPLVGLPGGRWAPAEWVWGDETAAIERRLGETAVQYLSALRRTILRRLGEMPLAAFQQIAIALLVAEGFRDIRPLEDGAPGAGDQLLLRARMPYGPAEISMVVLVVRGLPGKQVGEDQVAVLRGRLPRTGASGGAILTLGRVSDIARRDLVPPNAIPLLAIEHEAFADRLLERGVGVRGRCLPLPVLDPEVFGPFGDG